MGAVEHLLVRGVEHLEGRHDLARRHGLDLERAAGKLVDALGPHLEVLIKRERAGHVACILRTFCWACAPPAMATAKPRLAAAKPADLMKFRMPFPP